MNNNGGNMGRSNGGRPGVKTYALEFCEPVIANAGIFVLLIILDLWTQANSLIPIHAIAGIVAVLMTFALCRSSYVGLSWGLVIIPAVFLIISFINAAQKSATVQALGGNLKYAFDQTLAGAKYGYETVDSTYDALSDRVTALNTAGQKGLASVSNAWMTSYNALVNSGMKPAEAAVAATAENGKPPAGTAAATTAAASGANTTRTVVKGEYNYLCTPAPTDATLAAACQKCAADTDPDKCISIVGVNAVCLGNASKGDPPSPAKRDACLACTNPNKTTAQQDECRAASMKGLPVPVTPAAMPAAMPTVMPSAMPSAMPAAVTLKERDMNDPALQAEAVAFLDAHPDVISLAAALPDPQNPTGGPIPVDQIKARLMGGIAMALAMGISSADLYTTFRVATNPANGLIQYMKKGERPPQSAFASIVPQLPPYVQAVAMRFMSMAGPSVVSGFMSGSGSGPSPAEPSASAFKNARAPVAGTAENFRNF